MPDVPRVAAVARTEEELDGRLDPVRVRRRPRGGLVVDELDAFVDDLLRSPSGGVSRTGRGPAREGIGVRIPQNRFHKRGAKAAGTRKAGGTPKGKNEEGEELTL